MDKKQIALLIRLINYRLSYMLSLDSLNDEQETEFADLGATLVTLLRMVTK